MPKKQPKPEDSENVMPDVGYYRDSRCRAARSRGYAAGYDGQPETCPHPPSSPEATAWHDGYRDARKRIG